MVTLRDLGEAAVIDPASGRVTRRLRTGGEEPSGAAIAGDTAVVANRFSGSVAALDLAAGKQIALARLPGEPSEVVLSRDGKRAFVSVSQLDQVAVLEVPSLRLLRRVPVGRRPRAMALAPDGRTLLVACFQSGEVSFVDTASLAETRRVTLTGVNLRGIAVAPDGRRAYVTGQIPKNTRVTRDPLDIWTNTVFSVELSSGGRSGGSEGWIDAPLAAGPDPDGITALDGERLVVAAGGSDEALLVRASGLHTLIFDLAVERRAPVGARPGAVARTPDGSQVWVANELGGTLTVLRAADLQRVREIPLPAPPRPDPRQQGRYLFGHAGLTRGRQFTCASCHPDGRADGLSWEFVHVPDGVPVRNTRSLRGGVNFTAPFRWSGRETDIERFFDEEIVGLLHGPPQPHETLHRLWDLTARMPLPPNPHRLPDGRFTPAAVRGRALFAGKAGCASCHEGELAGGTGRKAWVGTTAPDLPLDVPHLAGVSDTDPFLHDGRARSLEAIFTQHNRARKHGSAHLLAPGELSDLLAYLREL